VISKKTMVTALLTVVFSLGLIWPVKGGDADQHVLFIDQLIGSWRGAGTLFGASATFQMKWEWTLDSQFVRLTFENRIPQADGKDFALKAQAFYKLTGEDQYEGTWFDSRGMVLPLNATAEDSSLVTLWGSPETEQGKTVYRIVQRDSIEVDDFVVKNGDWMAFGKASYGRAARK
jgi:hypothetical protein